MSDAEKLLLKEFGHELVDVLLPKAIAAEVAKLPVAYAGLSQVILAAVLPAIEAAIDAKLDAALV
jgi:hypothetical protein